MNPSFQMEPAFKVVLFDVGGTLWPDVFETVEEIRVPKVMKALGIDRGDHAIEVMKDLESTVDREMAEGGQGGKADIRRLVAHVLRARGLSSSSEIVDTVQHAMVVPAEDGRLFPGALELLQAIQRLGLRSGAVSNTVWRDGDDYRSDFDRLGLATHFAVIVTSIDAGIRKPHPGIFQLALDGLATSAERAIFVGNSEAADIVPARELGMYAIRVAIEEPPPASSRAHVIAGSLSEARVAIEALLP
jgi:FMN phosphatase YigB (HAD superfamily)